jgi:hypothetical protein
MNEDRLFDVESIPVVELPDEPTPGDVLGPRYEAAVDRMEAALRACPDDRWTTSMWEVRTDDAHVWPVLRGGGDASDEEKLQMYSAFWNVAYHALFHLDFYLSRGELPFEAPAPFREDEHHAQTLPDRVYTRDELLAYLAHCRAKARSILGRLTEAGAESHCRRMNTSFGVLLERNVAHVEEHGGQLTRHAAG